MHQRRFVGAELDLAGLHFLHGFGHIEGNRSGLGIRHQAARAEHFAQASDGLHHVRRGDHGVEIGPAFLLDLLHHVFAADDVSAGGFGFTHFLAAGNDQYFL